MTDIDGNQRTSPDEVEAEVGLRIRELRLRRKLTQLELAGRLSAYGEPWHQTKVAKTEAGQRPLRLGEVALLADALSVPIADLLPPLPPPLTDETEVRRQLVDVTSQVEATYAELKAGQRDLAHVEAEASMRRSTLVAIEDRFVSLVHRQEALTARLQQLTADAGGAA